MSETAQQQQLQQLIFLMDSMNTGGGDQVNGLDMFQEGLFSSTDGALEQLGPIFQSLYPKDKHESFERQVNLFLQKKDAEILNLCGSNQG
ncbi:hypothetical protein EV182_008343, partial [Spiromyces aspiralis]